MEPDADARAYDELSRHARIADLASIAAHVMTAAAELRRRDSATEAVGQLAADKHLFREDATTAFGNALDVLTRGPANDDERSLGRALAAHGLASLPPDGTDDARRAKTVLWLASHTPFDATTLLDRALGDRASTVWQAFAEFIRQVDSDASFVDRSDASSVDRGEALFAATALASAGGQAASSLARILAGDVRDPKLAFVLRETRRARSSASSGRLLRGEWTPSPRGSITTALRGLTGISFVVHTSRLFGRVALGFRRPAEVRISDDGALRIRWRVELLGRTLSERDVLVPSFGLMRAAREVRYPRLMLYAALLTLAMGSYFGVRALVDGVRATSPSLVVTGLFVIALGFALDLALTSIAPGARGQCRVVFVPRVGPSVCVGGVDIGSADAMLTHLAGIAAVDAAADAAPQRPSGDSIRSPSTASSRPADA